MECVKMLGQMTVLDGTETIVLSCGRKAVANRKLPKFVLKDREGEPHSLRFPLIVSYTIGQPDGPPRPCLNIVNTPNRRAF